MEKKKRISSNSSHHSKSADTLRQPKRITSDSSQQSKSPEMKRKKPVVIYDSSKNIKRAAADISGIERDPRLRFLSLNRSDGTEIWHDRFNGPTADMLDSTPDQDGDQCYMMLVELKDEMMIEWLKQLAEEIVTASDDVSIKQAVQEGTIKVFLPALPTGYRLYEQIRVPGSGRGEPRRDIFVYGHPHGPRKRFRSPIEFAPHAKWLSFDCTKDPTKCSCKACTTKG